MSEPQYKRVLLKLSGEALKDIENGEKSRYDGSQQMCKRE